MKIGHVKFLKSALYPSFLINLNECARNCSRSSFTKLCHSDILNYFLSDSNSCLLLAFFLKTVQLKYFALWTLTYLMKTDTVLCLRSTSIRLTPFKLQKDMY